MTDVGELTSQLQVVHDDPATDRKATLNIVTRCADLGLTPAETAEILGALGLVSSVSGGRYDPNGRRHRRGAESVQKLSTLARVRADAENPLTSATGASNVHQGDDGGDT